MLFGFFVLVQLASNGFIAALGPSVKGVRGAQLRRSLSLQGGEGSSKQEAAAE